MNRISAKLLFLLLGPSLFLGGCGKDPEPETQYRIPPSIPNLEPAPPPTPVLPSTGEITTSAPGPAPAPELSPEQKQIVFDRMIQEMRKAQAEGLSGGTVTVNGAWQYSGYSHLAPNPEAVLPARLVAVDLTVQGHNENFDLDDVEIIDGLSMVSYGSQPHVTFLAGDAEPLAEGARIPAGPDPTRALLIYAFPEATPKFTLYYWGKNLLEEPMPFEKSGWGLPYPKDPQ